MSENPVKEVEETAKRAAKEVEEAGPSTPRNAGSVATVLSLAPIKGLA